MKEIDTFLKAWNHNRETLQQGNQRPAGTEPAGIDLAGFSIVLCLHFLTATRSLRFEMLKGWHLDYYESSNEFCLFPPLQLEWYGIFSFYGDESEYCNTSFIVNMSLGLCLIDCVGLCS